MKRWDKILSILLIAAILGAIGTLAYVISTPKGSEKFTEFYILGIEGKAEQYPGELAMGEMGEIIMGIVNREHETASYRLEVWVIKDEVEEQLDVWWDEVWREELELELEHEEKWEHTIGFVLQYTGDDQKVEFRLFKNEENEPYLALHLYIDISSA